jgi:hypothetical protein
MEQNSPRMLKHRLMWMQAAMVLLGLLLAGESGVTLGQDLGTWQLVVENAGIAAMHAGVTRFGTVVLLDRTNIGASQIALPSKCLLSIDLTYFLGHLEGNQFVRFLRYHCGEHC